MKDYKSLKLRIAAGITDFLGSIIFFWVGEKKISNSEIKKVVILKFDRIGDTFLATPTIEGIRKLFPNAIIFIFSAPWNYKILEGNPNLDELKVLDIAPDIHKKGIISFLNLNKISLLKKEIMKIKPDIVIDLQGNPFNVLAMFFSKTPIKAGFETKVLSFLLNKKVGYSKNNHQTEMYFSVCRDLGYKGEIPKENIFIGEQDNKKVLDLLKEHGMKKYFVFHLGAGRSYRQWPLDNFVSLANIILQKDKDIKIAVIGGREDDKLAEELISKTQKDRVINFIGKLDIKESYVLLSYAQVFVGSESGPMHLAGCLNIPTLVFMNEWSGIDRWKPLGGKVFIFKSRPVHGCKGLKCKENPCPNMAAITVEEVIKSLENILK